MAKNMQPIAKRCKTLGISPACMGYAKKNTERNSATNTRRKKSEYALQLQEKQKVKFVYGIMEKQFRKYYEKAVAMPGKTGEELLCLIERRLDNVAYRIGFATTRREARQMVSHAHLTVNGKKVNIPSYLVKPGDVIALSEKSRGIERFKMVVEDNSWRIPPKWLDFERNKFEAKVMNLPARDDIDLPVEEHLIVELYSK